MILPPFRSKSSRIRIGRGFSSVLASALAGLRFLFFRRHQGQQIDRPAFVPSDVQLGRVEGDLREVEFRLERLEGRHDHVEALQPGDGVLFPVLEDEVPQRHVAGNDDDGVLIGRHGEGDRRLHVEFARGDGDIQFVRDVGQVEGDVQVLDEDVEDRLAGILEDFRFPFESVGVTVDRCGEPGLHVGVDILRNVGDKGDRDVHLPDGVRRVEGTVDEIDTAVLDDDVVDREDGRLLLFFLRLFLHQRKQIGEVVGLVLVADQVNIGLADDEFLDDGRPLEDRTDVEVDHQLVERHKGLFALGLLDLEPPQRDGRACTGSG